MPTLDTGGFSRSLTDMLAPFMRELRQIEVAGPPYTSLVASTMHKGLEIAMDEIAKRSPIAGGELSHGYRAVVHGEPLRRGYSGEVVNITDYAAAVEKGSKPHMPPVESIAWWVRVKGLAGPVTRKARREGVQIKFRRPGSSGRYPAGVSAEEWRIAWAMAIHIKLHGTKGAHMFRDGMKAARPEIVRLWGECLRDLLRMMAVRSQGAGP